MFSIPRTILRRASVLAIALGTFSCTNDLAPRDGTSSRAGPRTGREIQLSDVDRSVRSFLGEERLRALVSAERVRAYRIDGRGATPGAESSGERVGSFPVLEGPVDLDADLVHQIRTLAAKEESYDFASAKGCEFRPGFALELVSPKERPLFVLVCFECDEWAFLREGARVTEDLSREARAAFEKIARTSFPTAPWPF